LLLAGPAGSGKSTLAKNLIHFLTPPTEKQIRELSELNKSAMSWWPFISPHPSITAKAFLGNERMQGEMFRAHQGILMLDELLEFKPEALEVLRAPLDGHELLVSRVDQRVQKVSKFTCVATTNLCPCGDWLPDQRKEFECSLPERKCVQYRQKLSGPMLDRFEVLFFTDCKQEKFISFQDIMEKSEVLKRDFVATPQTDATRGLPDEIQNSLQGVSSRRRKAFFKLLHAVNTVHQNQKTFPEICKIAYDLTIGNFQKLQPQPLGMMMARNSLNRT
jgi:predicted ATPase with chaperone activity